MGEEPLGNAGYVITGSGGGGANGEYMFASLAELDGVIADWVALRDRIFARGEKLSQAKGLVVPPAGDPMSREHAQVLLLSLDRALDHNDAMFSYADGYVSKLTASRDTYSTTEDGNVALLRAVDES